MKIFQRLLFLLFIGTLLQIGSSCTPDSDSDSNNQPSKISLVDTQWQLSGSYGKRINRFLNMDDYAIIYEYIFQNGGVPEGGNVVNIDRIITSDPFIKFDGAGNFSNNVKEGTTCFEINGSYVDGETTTWEASNGEGVVTTSSEFPDILILDFRVLNFNGDFDINFFQVYRRIPDVACATISPAPEVSIIGEYDVEVTALNTADVINSGELIIQDVSSSGQVTGVLTLLDEDFIPTDYQISSDDSIFQIFSPIGYGNVAFIADSDNGDTFSTLYGTFAPANTNDRGVDIIVNLFPGTNYLFLNGVRYGYLLATKR